MLVTTSAYMAFGTLACSATGHLRKHHEFVGSLRSQRIWPPGTERMVAASVLVAEATIALIGIVAAVAVDAELLLSAAGTAAALYLLFTGYTAFLVGRRPGVPCGCGTQQEEVNVWTVVRTAGLALCSLLAAAGAGRLIGLDSPIEEVAVTVLAAVGLGGALWWLPATLALSKAPTRAATERGAR
ncbi:MauE/DoxX family redox-associated membrane protein [Actinomadura fulvescens]